MSRLITTLNYVESSDLAVNRWHLPNDVDLRHKALCAKKVNDVNIRQTAPNVLKKEQKKIIFLAYLIYSSVYLLLYYRLSKNI